MSREDDWYMLFVGDMKRFCETGDGDLNQDASKIEINSLM